MDSRGPAGPLHLMVVDDDPSCRESLGEFFRREGFTVRLASSGTEALQLVQQVRVDLWVLDVNMPGMSGVEVLRSLMNDRGPAGIPPTTLVSSDASAAQLTRQLLGLHLEFVPKPIRLEALRRSVRQLLFRSLMEGRRGLPGPPRD